MDTIKVISLDTVGRLISNPSHRRTAPSRQGSCNIQLYSFTSRCQLMIVESGATTKNGPRSF